MTCILEQLKVEILKEGERNIDKLIYNGLKGKARIPTDIIPKTRRCINKHSMALSDTIC